MFMTETLEKGDTEDIPMAEISKGGNRISYIPHHGFYHPTKDKLRVVFDCTALFQGVCLN